MSAIKWFMGDSEALIGGFKGKFEERHFKLFFNHSEKRALLYMLDGKEVPKELAKEIKLKMNKDKQFKDYDLFILIP